MSQFEFDDEDDPWRGPTETPYLEDQWAFKRLNGKSSGFLADRTISAITDVIIDILSLQRKVYPEMAVDGMSPNLYGSQFFISVRGLGYAMGDAGFDGDIINAIIPHKSGYLFVRELSELYYGVPLCAITADVIVDELTKLRDLSVFQLGEHIQRKLVAP